MAKKKDAWLKLFAEDACIEDPVGKSPLDETGKGHRGLTAIEGRCARTLSLVSLADLLRCSAFWDNNIAPNEFVFNIKESIQPQGSMEVMCERTDFLTQVSGLVEYLGVQHWPDHYQSSNDQEFDCYQRGVCVSSE